MKLILLPVTAFLMFTSIASADVFISSDGTGTYVGGLPGFASNGAYLSGTPTVTKDGYYTDGTAKKKYRHKKWQHLRSAGFIKRLSSLKSHSK